MIASMTVGKVRASALRRGGWLLMESDAGRVFSLPLRLEEHADRRVGHQQLCQSIPAETCPVSSRRSSSISTS